MRKHSRKSTHVLAISVLSRMFELLGCSGQALNEALPKIAQQVQGANFNGCWKRKAHFNRPSLWQCTEQMGQIKPLPLFQAQPQLVYPTHAGDMDIGHKPAPTNKASYDAHTNELREATHLVRRTHNDSDSIPRSDAREPTPLAKRKFANPHPIRTDIPGTADATGMAGSKYAPK
ncbi:hypothetical protein DPSP01_001201 [Paraphaeosphaeria sporulosa]